MKSALIKSKYFVFIAFLTLTGLALTSGTGPLATSTSYAATIWGNEVVPLGGTLLIRNPSKWG